MQVGKTLELLDKTTHTQWWDYSAIPPDTFFWLRKVASLTHINFFFNSIFFFKIRTLGLFMDKNSKIFFDLFMDENVRLRRPLQSSLLRTVWYIYIYITWLGWFGLRWCAYLGADGRTGPTSILKIYHWPLCQKPSVEPWAGRGSVVRPLLSMPVYPWTGLTNAPRSRSRSKCETKEKKK